MPGLMIFVQAEIGFPPSGWTLHRKLYVASALMVSERSCVLDFGRNTYPAMPQPYVQSTIMTALSL